MTELITTKKSDRKELKTLIQKINNGVQVEIIRKEFNELLNRLGIKEFALIENELLEEGLPREKLEKLCDVHASMIPTFKYEPKDVNQIPGHPVHSFLQENIQIRSLLKSIDLELKNQISEANFDNNKLLNEINLLYDIEKHFLRKEMLLFPILEHYGFDGPSKVMWAIHDKIRTQLKDLSEKIENIGLSSFNTIVETFKLLSSLIENLLIKEETILYPTSIKMLSEADWKTLYDESLTYGYCLYEPKMEWKIDNISKNLLDVNFENNNGIVSDLIKLTTGNLSSNQLSLIFSNLPISFTFIDEKDVVKFYSHGTNKIFNRTNAIIGRKVQNCHPPKSLHVVKRILNEFKTGISNKADFWIQQGENFIYICFYAIRDENKRYNGTLEFVQDITYLRGLRDEKRILS